MAIVFMMNEEIARGMVCFFHQKKHSYLISYTYLKQNSVAETHPEQGRKLTETFLHLTQMSILGSGYASSGTEFGTASGKV
jgi:hypothetical protein